MQNSSGNLNPSGVVSKQHLLGPKAAESLTGLGKEGKSQENQVICNCRLRVCDGGGKGIGRTSETGL